MQKRGAKPRTKCKITMEMGITGKVKFRAVKGPNSIVRREEAQQFLTDANEWLTELAISWDSIYEKEEG